MIHMGNFGPSGYPITPETKESPKSSICDTYDGLVVDIHTKHYKKALAASIHPYKQPLPPTTLEQLRELVEVHGVHWHVVDINMDTKFLLHLDLTLSDLRVLQSIADGVEYNNYSITHYTDIMTEYGMSKSQVFKSINRLKSLNLLNEVSKELLAVRPSIAWCGEWGIRYNEESKWAIGKHHPTGYLWSDEYIQLVRKYVYEQYL